MNNLSFSWSNFDVFPSDNISCLEMGFIIQPQFFDIRSSFFSIPLRHTNSISSDIRFRTNFVFKDASWFFCHNNTEKQHLNIYRFNSIAPNSNSADANASLSPNGEDLICVKEKKQSLLYFPKSATPTSFNLDIKSNLNGGSQWGATQQKRG